MRWVLVTASLAGLVGWTHAARAADDATVECIRTSENAQRLRDEGKLAEALPLFRACAQPSCPAVVSRDCTTWFTDAERRQPTVLLAAKDASGRDLTEVKVLLDGAPFAERLGAAAVPLDPGEHVFRFEAPGREPTETKLLIRDGEKGRLVSVVLAERAERPVAPPTAAERPAERKVPVLALALGGVALAGAGAFAYLWFSGVDEYRDLERTCAPGCTEDEISSTRTKILVADVALGVGIAAAVGAVVAYVAAPKQAARSPAALLQSGVVRF